MKFTAFDFETCSPDRSTSAVELGVCLYQDGKLYEQRGWRFFPLVDQFDERTCSYSGIHRDDVEGLPNFEQLWEQIRPYFMVDVIVAHNLWGFDLDVLYRHLNHFGESVPVATGLCTCDFSRRILPGLDNHKLPTVCRHLEIPFSKKLHHSAVFDAKACADVFLQLLGMMSNDASAFGDVAGSTADFQPQATDSIFNDYGSAEVDDFCLEDESGDEFDLNHLEGAKHLDNEDDQDTLMALAERLFALGESDRHVDLLRGWAFAITGDVADVCDGRAGLANTLIRLGAKCDKQNQSFAKSGKATHGPTNSIVFTKGEELLRFLRGDINGKFKKAAETMAKGQQSLRFLSEKALYEFVLDCVENGRSPSFEAYIEEELVSKEIRPVLSRKAEEIAIEKQSGGK